MKTQDNMASRDLAPNADAATAKEPLPLTSAKLQQVAHETIEMFLPPLMSLTGTQGRLVARNTVVAVLTALRDPGFHVIDALAASVFDRCDRTEDFGLDGAREALQAALDVILIELATEAPSPVTAPLEGVRSETLASPPG